MTQGRPDPQRFADVVGGMLARLGGGRRVRAFGEMVALLWAEGNGRGAVRLEELWNELAERYCFSLYCAYPISGFRGEVHGQSFADICTKHHRVIPGES